ncbi:MAG: hypothetical protein OXI71_06185 [Gemmatimonadota bacterium]|nr:hypothetical protein [Gemmatimonadota bacterium]MDE2679423.1 hypothetical protein [Gemmatimonadota bacterium]
MSAQWWQAFGAIAGVVVATVVAAGGATWWSARAARAAVDALYDRLKDNDFKHIEVRLEQMDDRIGRVEERMTARIDRVETRLDGTIGRLSHRMEEGFRELKALIQGAQTG